MREYEKYKNQEELSKACYCGTVYVEEDGFYATRCGPDEKWIAIPRYIVEKEVERQGFHILEALFLNGQIGTANILAEQFIREGKRWHKHNLG